MLRVYKKGGDRGSLNDIGKGFAWVDIITPSAKDFKEISRRTPVKLNDLKEFYDPDEKPKIIKNRKYFIIIYKSISLEKSNASNYIQSIAIYVLNNCIVTVRKTGGYFSELKNSVQNKNQLVYHLLDLSTAIFFKEFDQMQEQISNIESEILKSPNKKLVSKIFDIKKKLVVMHKVLISNRDVIASLQRDNKLFDTNFSKQLELIYYDLAQLIETTDTYMEILSASLEMYSSSISNNLNTIMKTLTIITATFMFPTLIAAIYGMNFVNTPEFLWKYGYAWAWGLMIISVIILLMFFKKKGWMKEEF